MRIHQISALVHFEYTIKRDSSLARQNQHLLNSQYATLPIKTRFTHKKVADLLTIQSRLRTAIQSNREELNR